MCEYCGCQEIAVIDELSREHEALVGLIGEVRAALRADTTAGMAAAARRIAAVLGPHTAVEERGLFPALHTEFPEHVDGLVAEHRQIEEVLAEAANGVPSDPSWPRRVLASLALLREHILKEQDGLFPAALISLDATDWETIEAVRAEVGSALDGRRLAS